MDVGPKLAPTMACGTKNRPQRVAPWRVQIQSPDFAGRKAHRPFQRWAFCFGSVEFPVAMLRFDCRELRRVFSSLLLYQLLATTGNLAQSRMGGTELQL
jgi:hypothetical protein